MLTARKRLGLPLFFASTLACGRRVRGRERPRSGEPDKVTCMYPVWVGFGPVHLANELGYFKEEGITVEEILDDDMPNGVAAMERGDIDCYLRTVGEYQGLGRRKDTQGIIIGTIDLSTGGDGWAADQCDQVGLRPQGQDHRGRAEPAGAPDMQMALKKRVQPVDQGHQPRRHRGGRRDRRLRRPDVAAVGTYEPVLSQVVAAHQDRGAHILASSKDYEDLILDIIMAHTDELHGPPGQIRQVPARHLSGGRLLQRATRRRRSRSSPALLDHARGLQGDAAELPLHALRARRRADRHAGQGGPRLRGLPRGHGPESRVRLLRRQAVPGGPHRPRRSSRRCRRTGSEASWPASQALVRTAGRPSARRPRPRTGARRRMAAGTVPPRGRRARPAPGATCSASGRRPGPTSSSGSVSAPSRSCSGLAAGHRARAGAAAVPAFAARGGRAPGRACSRTPTTCATSASASRGSGSLSWPRRSIAIPLGMLMSSYRAVGAFSEPLIDFVRYLPVPALVPLTLIWLGIGEGSKIALLWIGTFFQLVLLVADDARRVPKEFIETGRTLGAGDWALMKDVLFRGHAAQHGRQPAHHAGLVLDLPASSPRSSPRTRASATSSGPRGATARRRRCSPAS